LWIGLILSLFSLLTRNILYRVRGIITSGHFGAIIELAEALSLTLLAAL
jgi:hypothetical protein